MLASDKYGPTRAIFHYGPMICSGNRVAVEGINRGYFNGVYVEQPVALFFEIADSKIQTVTIYYDRLGLRGAVEK